MKIALNRLLLGSLLAALGLAANAQTSPAPPATPPRMQHPHDGRHDPAKFQEHMAERQAQLRQKLQISPAQEGAWTAYSTAMKPPANFQRPDRAEFERLSTPERIDRIRAFRAQRAAEMDRRMDASKTFYATLTPEQKKVFDAETARHGHRGGHGPHQRG